MEKEINLYDLLENKNYRIVLDTNILLNYYRLDSSEKVKFYNILKKLFKYIVIPSTVSIEFEKQYKDVIYSQKSNLSLNRIKKPLIELARETNYCLKDIEKHNYKNIKEIKLSLTQLYKQTKETYDEITNKYENNLNKFANVIYSDNAFYDFFKSLFVMKGLKHQELYDLGREAEQKYKTKICPGYKDNGKESYRKYNDYYIWWEIKRYSKENKKHIVFVTNDLKSDWYKKKNGQHKIAPYLKKDFSKETHHKIIALSYQDFYDLTITYNKDITKRIADNLTEYINLISDNVFYEIENNLCQEIEDNYFGEKIRINYKNYPGSEGFENIEINEFYLSHYSFKEEEDNIVYNLSFNVEVYASSKDYWGRDEDNHEPYYSPNSHYTFNGNIEVEATRSFKDFENNDNYTFERANIIQGELNEISYISWREEDDGNYYPF